MKKFEFDWVQFRALLAALSNVDEKVLRDYFKQYLNGNDFDIDDLDPNVFSFFKAGWVCRSMFDTIDSEKIILAKEEKLEALYKYQLGEK